jgi:hypothetical protein
MDSGGGRYMGDTTSLYLLEMYEIYRHNGNKSFIEVRAVLALPCPALICVDKYTQTQTQTREAENCHSNCASVLCGSEPYAPACVCILRVTSTGAVEVSEACDGMDDRECEGYQFK